MRGYIANCLRTKILNDRRAPIPVVQADLYQEGATIAGAINSSEVPLRSTPTFDPCKIGGFAEWMCWQPRSGFATYLLDRPIYTLMPRVTPGPLMLQWMVGRESGDDVGQIRFLLRRGGFRYEVALR